MARIQTGNPKIKAWLKELVGIVLEEGGAIHKSLVFSCVKNEMTLKLAKPVKQGVSLLRVPTHCMPVLNYFSLSFDGHRILAEPLVGEGATPSAIQERVLDLMLALFNETDKVNSFAEFSPLVAFREHPDILATLADSFSTRSSVFDLVDGDLNELKLQAFLHSRAHQEGGDIRLLPLIDFADHHTHAKGFNHYHDVLGNTESIEIQSNHMSGQAACMACYKYRDALSSFINYGFLDKSVAFLQSVPVTVELGEFALQIEAGYLNDNQLGMDRINLAIPGHRFESDQTPFYISTFCFPNEKTMQLHYMMLPFAEERSLLVDVLAFQLTCFEKRFDMAPTTLNSPENIERIQSSLLNDNVEYYQKLSALLVDSRLKKTMPAVNIMHNVIKAQLKILASYQY